MIILTIIIVLLLLMYLFKDMPDWDKTHHDGRKNSFYEISNRKGDQIMISKKDIFVKTPIIWRAQGVDYYIDHIVSVKPWWNVVTKTNGIKVSLVNGDFDVICFLVNTLFGW